MKLGFDSGQILDIFIYFLLKISSKITWLW